MPIKTWAHSGGDFQTRNVNVYSSGSSNGGASPAWDAACAAWVATNNENGDTGTVNMAGDGGAGAGVAFANMTVSMQFENDGSISSAETVNTVRLVFDWAITNGPMGTATAQSELTSFDPAPDSQGSGASTGTYDHSMDGVTFGTPTMGDFFAAVGDPGGAIGVGLVYAASYTAGVFSAHNRRLAVSNLVWHIDYGASAPVVTDVSPSHGDLAGGTVVTLTGTGFTGTTTATFNGSTTTFTPSSDVSGTCVTPAHAVGDVTVSVS